MNDKSQQLGELIKELAASVQRFHERFGIVGPTSKEELLSRIPIQEEEVRELHQAILHEPAENQAAEAVDILYVAIGTVLRLEPGLASRAIREVITKNDGKTWQTHHINAVGKVARRG
ncbi:MAG: hypothetical protein HY532_00050 [Chloroflexi bacterium]|nr:hypothetical protein [Chloroflexota bacterium]